MVKEYMKKEYWSSTIGNGYHEFLLPSGEWKRLQEIIGSAEYNAFIEMMEKLPDSQAKRHIREVALHYDEKVVDATPSVWVGEVSWLKAAVSGDNNTYIPDIVGEIRKLIGNKLPVVSDTLIAKVQKVFRKSKNTTEYKVDDGRKVIAFLKKHKGKRAFCISW